MDQKNQTALRELAGSLTVRILLQSGVYVVLLVILGTTLTIRSLDVQERLQEEQIEGIGTSTTSFVSQLIFPFLQFEQTEDIERLLSDTYKNTAHTSYVALVNKAGEVAAASPRGYQPAQAVLADVTTNLTIEHGGKSVRHFSALVELDGESADHHLFIGIDRTPSLEKLKTLRRASITTLVVFLLVSLALLLGMVIWIWRSGRKLSGAAEIIASTAHDLEASAGEILAVARQTESTSADQAAAVDETRRTMSGLVEAANEIAEASNKVLDSAERSAHASSTIAERIATLNTQALRITSISETIQTIADKSDILALNASLEGAKAGEVGRGFVLVGAEMRRLAEIVMGAVRQIRQLTEEIREQSNAAVLAAEDGQRLAVETRENSRRITTITGQQRSGTQQISMNMDEFQQYTKQALTGATQTKETANDLVRTAGDLNLVLTGAAQSEQAAR